jgi:hypothetical protein
MSNASHTQILVHIPTEDKVFDLLPKEIQIFLQNCEGNYSTVAVAKLWLLWRNDGYSPKAFLNAFRAHGNK